MPGGIHGTPEKRIHREVGIVPSACLSRSLPTQSSKVRGVRELATDLPISLRNCQSLRKADCYLRVDLHHAVCIITILMQIASRSACFSQNNIHHPNVHCSWGQDPKSRGRWSDLQLPVLSDRRSICVTMNNTALCASHGSSIGKIFALLA